MHVHTSGRLRQALPPVTLNGTRRDTTAPTTARLESGATAGSEMRRANGRRRGKWMAKTKPVEGRPWPLLVAGPPQRALDLRAAN